MDAHEERQYDRKYDINEDADSKKTDQNIWQDRHMAYA